ADEAEEHLLAALVDRDRLDAERHRAVLVLGEGRGVQDLEPDLAAREDGVALEQRAHARRVGAVRRHRLAELGRIEEAERHRLLHLAQGLERPFREREGLVLGEIERRAAYGHVRERVERRQKDERDDERADDDAAARFQIAPHGYCPFLSSSTSVFANRNTPMTERKKMRSRKSITPFLIWSKWLRKLNEATRSTRLWGSTLAAKPSTRFVPPSVKRKQIAAASTNAITWFLVVADRQEPIAR